MHYIIILLLALLPSTISAQDNKQVLGDSIKSLENNILQLKSNLEYGTDKFDSSIIAGGEVFICKVLRAYYEDTNLCIDVQFFSNSEGILKIKRSSRNVFCILNERFLPLYFFKPYYGEISVDLKSGIPENVTMTFSIYEYHFDIKPRLIEYLKIKEENTEQDFIFKNIVIDMDKDK